MFKYFLHNIISMTKVIIPYAMSSQVRELIGKIYPGEKCRINSFYERHNKSKSAYVNIIPTAEILGLIKAEKDIIHLTEDGINFGRASTRNNIDEMKKIVKKNIKDNVVFNFVLDLAKAKGVIRNEGIGERLASKFDKRWTHPQTFARHGSCCAEILSFAGFGVYHKYHNGTFSIKEAKLEESEEIALPTVRIAKIKKILSRLISGAKTLSELSSNTKTTEGRLSSELRTATLLGLTEKIGQSFTLSESGKIFVDPLCSEEERRKTFGKCLFKSYYRRIIERLCESDTIKAVDLGEILAYELQKDWNNLTKKDYGKRLMDWLKYARIVSKEAERGVYRINKDILEQIESESIKSFEKTGLIKSPTFTPPLYFKLGKLIERIKMALERKENFDNEINELISICASNSELKSSSEVTKSHYELYREIQDPRIIVPDIELIEKLIEGLKNE